MSSRVARNRNGVKLIPSSETSRNSHVRVKMKRLAVNYGKLYPPDGETKNWWLALKAALGTKSSSFLKASLAQLQAAARLPDGPVSETGMNAALALIQATAPQNEIEGALAVQMACTHAAAMTALSRTASAGYRTASAHATTAAALMRSFTTQIEALRRIRSSNVHSLQVGHVQINDGGQAVIGTVAVQVGEGN